MATKFTAEFIEESMRRHKLWQHEQERELYEEIIEEIQMMPRRARKTTGFLDFEGRVGRELPGRVQ